MNEENENQPAPLEAESASTEQRQHRPRRRYPRRRYRDRSNRFGSDNFNDSSNDAPNSSPATADPATGSVGVETLDRSASGGPEGESAVEKGEKVQRELEFDGGIIGFTVRGFDVLSDPTR